MCASHPLKKRAVTACGWLKGIWVRLGVIKSKVDQKIISKIPTPGLEPGPRKGRSFKPRMSTNFIT